MNLELPSPPILTGAPARDTAELNNWCERLRRRLNYVLANLDDSNIRSVNAEKIVGLKEPEKEENDEEETHE